MASTTDRKGTRKERKVNDLTRQELSMLGTTANLTDDEIQRWHTEFLRKFPSGRLDRDTFANVYKQLYPNNEMVLSCNTLFDLIDQNHDGTLDFNEFLFLTAVGIRTGSLDERLEVIFELWDVSNDGLLDRNELAHLISAMYDRVQKGDRTGDQDPFERAKEIILKLDVTGDKKLNKDEFINGCKNDEIIRRLLAPDA